MMVTLLTVASFLASLTATLSTLLPKRGEAYESQAYQP